MIDAGLVVIALVIPVEARAQPVNIPLKWMLNVKGEHPEELPTIQTTGGLRRLAIGPMVDVREQGLQVGEDTEHKPTRPVMTSDDIPGFVRQSLINQLRVAGIPLDPAAEDRALRFELLQFWTTGHRSYRAEIRVRCTLVDQSDKEIWSAIVGGVGENYGRAHRAENYDETLSNAVFELVVNLLKEDRFIRGLRKQE